MGNSRSFYVPNNGKDPEAANRRYRIRGNGVWTFRPDLSADGLKAIHGVSDCAATKPLGVIPQKAGKTGAVVFKIQGANGIALVGEQRYWTKGLAP